ncbi:MAG: hypothetical protein UV34_C0017G0018 [Parcubacteria group bacterium GW2011_GWB1_42_6]|nr:MAG: hypothetical protein UV34_C0017G0018 [Parcubacteria group bacterium GW2011_GWB1_42_6]
MKKNIFWEFIKKHKIAILLILVMATAIFFRLYKLGQIPPGLYPDVAINGNDALQALKSGDFKAFYPENNGREGLFMNLIAASFWLFGASVWAIKIVPAILGILTERLGDQNSSGDFGNFDDFRHLSFDVSSFFIRKADAKKVFGRRAKIYRPVGRFLHGRELLAR